jgi:DNA-binding NtrC family response regulator
MEASTIKLLIVDDEPQLLNPSSQILEIYPCISTNSALSAEEALELIGTNEYVVVSDFQHFKTEMRGRFVLTLPSGVEGDTLGS